MGAIYPFVATGKNVLCNLPYDLFDITIREAPVGVKAVLVYKCFVSFAAYLQAFPR